MAAVGFYRDGRGGFLQEGDPLPGESASVTYDALLPVGSLLPFAGEMPPPGWLLCDGLTVPIDDYPRLYAVYGLLYGGDGVTTFQLPDCRGQTLVGSGQGMNTPERTLGQRFGSHLISLTVEQMPPHSHHEGAQLRALRPQGGSVNPRRHFTTSTWSGGDLTNYAVVALDTFYEGWGEPVEVNQPSLVVNHIIWTGAYALDLTQGDTPMDPTEQPEITVYTTVTNGSDTQTVAFTYEIAAGDVMVSILLLAVLMVMILNTVLRIRQRREG